MNKKQLKLSRKTRKDMANALLKHHPFIRDRASANKALRSYIEKDAESFKISAKNPRRRAVVKLTMTRPHLFRTFQITAFCGQKRKLEVLVSNRPIDEFGFQPGDTYVRY